MARPGVRFDLVHGLLDGVEDWKAQVLGTTLALANATNHVSPILNGLKRAQHKSYTQFI